jgi:hypothetical protein
LRRGGEVAFRKDDFEDLGVDGREILKLILRI